MDRHRKSGPNTMRVKPNNTVQINKQMQMLSESPSGSIQQFSNQPNRSKMRSLVAKNMEELETDELGNILTPE